MCVENTAECLSQAENGRQQLHVAYGICGGEYSPFLYLYATAWLLYTVDVQWLMHFAFYPRSVNKIF